MPPLIPLSAAQAPFLAQPPPPAQPSPPSDFTARVQAMEARLQQSRLAEQASRIEELEAEAARLDEVTATRRQRLGRSSPEEAPPSYFASPHHSGNVPRVQPLVHIFPAVEPKHFHDMLRNSFRPPDIIKLSTEFTATGALKKDNAVEADTKNMSDLLYHFDIYSVALATLQDEPLRFELLRALVIYKLRLHEHHKIYSFQSIRDFHFKFHNKRIYTGINDPTGWQSIDHDLESRAEHLPRPPCFVDMFLQ